MRSRLGRTSWPLLGLALLVLGLTLLAQSPIAGLMVARERVFDFMLQATSRAPSGHPVVVVDIDRATLEEIGPWPWRRERLAELIARIADMRPKAIGVDILIEGRDERSPAMLARRLAEATGKSELDLLAQSLPDGDVILAEASRRAPLVFGIALDPDGGTKAPPAPAVLVRGAPNLSGVWIEDGAIGPPQVLTDAAAGLGVLSLPGDSDARIRNVPLLTEAAGVLRPGLAVETVRLARAAGAYVVSGRPAVLGVADLAIPLGALGFLRLRPSVPDRHEARTISARDVLAKGERRELMRGAIVLLGGSAPQLAGQRASASGELVPSVQLQADAVTQLLARDWPQRPASFFWIETLAMLGLGGALAWCGRRLRALDAGLIAIAAGLAWIGGAQLSLAAFNFLVDPVGVPVVAGTAYGCAAVLAAAETRRREEAIRHRFEQHLAPEVVRRMAAQPGLLKLEGELREITALFTDIEGFTAMTERADPRALVRVLDRYIEEASRIVVEHGGMVEKIVGDGLHVIFNAPLDLADHPQRALEAALALHHFAERFKAEAGPAAIGFGRTRIGFETGEAIVGDVGGGRRLDYTAHGNAMNLAARLEAANKELGTAICIGPGAAARIDPALLTSLGTLPIRGRSQPMPVFTAAVLGTGAQPPIGTGAP